MVPSQGLLKDLHRTFLNLTNPELQSHISGESANRDFGRGGRYKAILMDEFAFWDFDTEAWKACSQSTPCRIAISTANSIGKFKRLRFGTDGENIKVKTLLWSRQPNKDQQWYEREKQRLDPDTFAQEIDISYETSAKGSVYGTEMKMVRFGSYPYDPSLPLYVSHDFGLDDSHAIGWFQLDPATWRPRLIRSFEKSGQLAKWFFPFFGKPIESGLVYTAQELEMIRLTSGFKAAIHYGDPSGANRNEVTGTSVIGEFEKVGIYIQTNPGANEFTERRNATKRLLMNMEADLQCNQQWKLCMEQAHYPQRQEASQATTPIIKPVHDWTSHMRTMTEYFAVNMPQATEKDQPLPDDGTEENDDVY
jgi:hypothetical protein